MKLLSINFMIFLIMIITFIIMPPTDSKAQKDSITIKPVVQLPSSNPLSVKQAKEQLRSVLSIQNFIKADQEKLIAANKDTILMKMNRKVKYIKVYKTVTIPLYISSSDTATYLTAIRDTARDIFLDTIATRKRFFLKGIFHHKQN